MVKIFISPNDLSKVQEILEDSELKFVDGYFECPDDSSAAPIAELVLEDNEIAYRVEDINGNAVYMPEHGYYDSEESNDDYLRVTELFEEYCKI